MEQHKELINQIKSSIDFLMKKNNELLSKIPKEKQQEFTDISVDINSAINAAKEGNLEKIMQLNKKYNASKNNI
mgnify:CR=1 FL=1|jgi:hypothetical protein|tara:strand:- start:11533 stop:11754 length:222 start_codon:yes stop_codon:yes gene_type:complete